MFKEGDLVEVYFREDWVTAEIELVHDEGYDAWIPSVDLEEYFDENDVRSLKGSSKNNDANNVSTSEFDKMNAEFEALQVSNDSDFEAAEKAYQAGLKPAQHTLTIADMKAIGVL